MSEKWQCPRCNTVHRKPAHVLRLGRLRESLGVIGLGKSAEAAPRCSNCGFEADVNAMLAGEYDALEEKVPVAPQEPEEKPLAAPSAMPAKTDRAALLVVGGLIFILVCLCVAGASGAAIYLIRSKAEALALPQATPRETVPPLPSAVTTPPGLAVRMLAKTEAQRLFETQDIPFLARRAVEQYTEDEINQMGLMLTYTIHLDKSEPLAWGMGWCTTTKDILNQNFEHIRYTFILNGKTISTSQFVVFDFYSENLQGYCRQYYAILTDWPVGETVIQTVVTYDQPINDGWDDYPAGTKTYEYRVILRP